MAAANKKTSAHLVRFFQAQTTVNDEVKSFFEMETERLAVPRFRLCVVFLFLLYMISFITEWNTNAAPNINPSVRIEFVSSALLLCFGVFSFVPPFRKSCYAFTIMLAIFVGATTMLQRILNVQTGFDQMVTFTLFFILMGFLMPWGAAATASVCVPLYIFYPLGIVLGRQEVEWAWFIKSNSYLLFFIFVSMVASRMNETMRFKEFTLKSETERENRVLQDYQVRLKRAYERVETLALVDTLTGAYNRSYMTRWLTNEIYKDKECLQVFSLIMFDVDGFKTINDLAGHQQGDRILQLVAHKVKNTLSERNLIFRYGGDEFCIILPGQRLPEAVRAAEQLRQSVEQDPDLVVVMPSRDSFHITISLGVTTEIPQSTIDTDFLIKWVDAALLESKRQGRNCIHVFDSVERKIVHASEWLRKTE
ncbi:MAG TPA: GGDEF domain-containing protein [Verrucomicrobiae bacterium]|jgi:diguanylate cyclase (GGDEF)-like protein|nr:GGDEF domain-containing protein [Verrucomicrobiae bacterium]